MKRIYSIIILLSLFLTGCAYPTQSAIDKVNKELTAITKNEVAGDFEGHLNNFGALLSKPESLLLTAFDFNKSANYLYKTSERKAEKKHIAKFVEVIGVDIGKGLFIQIENKRNKTFGAHFLDLTLDANNADFVYYYSEFKDGSWIATVFKAENNNLITTKFLADTSETSIITSDSCNVGDIDSLDESNSTKEILKSHFKKYRLRNTNCVPFLRIFT